MHAWYCNGAKTAFTSYQNSKTEHALLTLSLDQNANSDENAVDLILTFKSNVFLRKQVSTSEQSEWEHATYIWMEIPWVKKPLLCTLT